MNLEQNLTGGYLSQSSYAASPLLPLLMLSSIPQNGSSNNIEYLKESIHYFLESFIESAVKNLTKITGTRDPHNITAECTYTTPYAASHLLPILLLSMTEQRHAPETTTDIKDTYDYIVVGAGSGGSVVAGRLSENSCATTLLLEAGDSPPKLTDLPVISKYFTKTDIDWAFQTTPQKHTGKGLINRTITLSAGKAFGGSSVINGLQVVRGNRKDFDQWAAEGSVGWSYEEVLPYFKKMEDNTDPEIASNGYHGIKGPLTVSKPRYGSELRNAVIEAAIRMGYRFLDSNGRSQEGFYDLQASMRDGQRCSTSKAYLVPNSDKGNLDIVAKAFVTKIVIENNEAKGVEFELGGRKRYVRARKEVIVSAGAINTPKLLMLSGIGPKKELKKHKIPVKADLPVGQNLQEQYGVLTEFELGDKIELFSQKIRKEANVWNYIMSKTGPLTSVTGVSNIAFLSQGFPDSQNDLPDYQLYFLEGVHEVMKQKCMINSTYHEAIYEPYKEKPFYLCFSTLLRPKGRGYVALRSSDPHDPPIIDPKYFSHPDDLEVVVAGMKKCKEIATSEPLVKIGSKPFSSIYPGCDDYVGDDDKYFRCMARSIIQTCNHQAGTVKMGDPRDPTTVVDPQLRVKGIRNLRVVDASIMPNITSGNTNIPTVMIAEKASDMIKESFTCESKNDLNSLPYL